MANKREDAMIARMTRASQSQLHERQKVAEYRRKQAEERSAAVAQRVFSERVKALMRMPKFANCRNDIAVAMQRLGWLLPTALKHSEEGVEAMRVAMSSTWSDEPITNLDGALLAVRQRHETWELENHAHTYAMQEPVAALATLAMPGKYGKSYPILGNYIATMRHLRALQEKPFNGRRGVEILHGMLKERYPEAFASWVESGAVADDLEYWRSRAESLDIETVKKRFDAEVQDYIDSTGVTESEVAKLLSL